MPWDFAFTLAILGLVIPWRGTVRIRHLLRQPFITTSDRLALYASTAIFQWVVAGFVFWRCTVRGLAPAHLAVTLRARWSTVSVGLILSALVTAQQLSSIRRLAHLPADRHSFLREMARKLMPQNPAERAAFVALAVTVSLCEEFLYRGFVQAIFQDVARGSVLIGVVGSATFFSAAHLYQGRRGTMTTFFAGVILSLIRTWAGSLVPTILVHFAADVTAGLATPIFLATVRPAMNENASAPRELGPPVNP